MALTEQHIQRVGPLARPRLRSDEQATRVSATLSLLLALALLHGLLYLAFAPPWQHYDEPTHFEYARLIAVWGRQPALNESDVTTTQEIADSMERFRFWNALAQPDILGANPSLLGSNEKIHPPLYYAFVAVPVRWLIFASVEQQLYAGRVVGVLLYALVIATAWRIATVLAPDRPSTQMALPLIVLLVPAFADQMSAVNNDVLVNFSTSALLLGCVLLIRDGFRPVPAALAVLGLITAVLTKRTAAIDVIPFCLTLFWSLRRQPLRPWVGPLILLLGGLVVAVGVFTTGPTGLTVQPWLVRLDQDYLRLGMAKFTISQPDWPSLGQDYTLLLWVLFRSFWIRFGWGAVSIGAGWDWAVLLVVLVGLIGLIVRAFKPSAPRIVWQRRAIWLFVVTIVFAWIATIVRFEIERSGYLPRGRYLHLAIIPTIWLLMLGVERLAPKRWRRQSVFALTLFFAVLDVVAWSVALSTTYYR